MQVDDGKAGEHSAESTPKRAERERLVMYVLNWAWLGYACLELLYARGAEGSWWAIMPSRIICLVGLLVLGVMNYAAFYRFGSSRGGIGRRTLVALLLSYAGLWIGVWLDFTYAFIALACAFNILVWGWVALAGKTARLRKTVIAVSFCVLVPVAVEAVQRGMLRLSSGRGLPDYLDLIGRPEGGLFFDGGRLKPNVDTQARHFSGRPVRWRTNDAGFRADHDFRIPKPDGVVRVMLLGDSFVAGYRLGQAETLGAHLEKGLRAREEHIEVLAAVADDPLSAGYYLDRHGMRYDPDVAVLGVCLANDIVACKAIQAPDGPFEFVAPDEVAVRLTRLATSGAVEWMRKTRLPDGAYTDNMLTRPFRHVRWHVSKTHLGMRTSSLLVSSGLIGSATKGAFYWMHDLAPRQMDWATGLGFFLDEDVDAPLVDDCFRELARALDFAEAVCRKRSVRLVVVIFPQRFQVSAEDWGATCCLYCLNPEAFDLQRPNRLIAQWCARKGVTMVDPTGALRNARRTDPDAVLYQPGDIHFTDAGCELVSGKLLPVVDDLVAERRRQ